MNLFVYIFNVLFKILYLKNYKNFLNKTTKVKDIQKSVLLNILKENQKCRFATDFNFENIKSIFEYQNNVPLSEYEDYTPYIQRIISGEQSVLTDHKVTTLSVTSGTSSASKYIPINSVLKREFSKAINVWLCDLFINFPQLLSGKQFWVVSPMAAVKKEQSSVYIGFEKDTSYLGFIGKYFIRKIQVIPEELKLEDPQNHYYILSLLLLYNRNVRLISVWNPLMLLNILKFINSHFNQLVNDIQKSNIKIPNPDNKRDLSIVDSYIIKDPERASELFHQKGNWLKIWPKLEVISCWTESWASCFIDELKSILPGIYIQGKGLLATEAIITIPLHEFSYPVLCYESHFFEFRSIEDNNIYLAHNLRINKYYEVIVTTSGGLYRYNLHDIVEVKGYKNEAPLLKFIGKSNVVSDITGEKLNELHVSKIIDSIILKYCIKNGIAFLKARKDGDFVRYVLYIDKNILQDLNHKNSIQTELEEELSNNYHYKNSRVQNQLMPCEVVFENENVLKKYMNVSNFSKSTSKHLRLYINHNI